MNKVLINENKEQNIQIYRSSKKMATEAKLAKIIMYIVNFIPLILVLTQDLFGKDPYTANLIKFSSSAVSLILNILTELISNIVANHKEKSVLLAQLFETQITGKTLSKMEYDRETTNELYEIAIRKGTLKKEKNYTGAYDVPQEIDDKYTYLFINRYIAAENRFLLDKLQIIYGVIIAVVSILFIFFLANMNMAEAVYYFVCFWSVFIPIVRNFAKCSKNKKQCVKISADIDNFFAEGDDSPEKLYRFNAYIQSLSFELRTNLVIIPTTLHKLLAFQIKVLDVGVTNRFIEAVYQFENLVMSKKGIKTRKQKFEWISRNDKSSSSAAKKSEIINKAKQSSSKATKQKKTDIQVPVSPEIEVAATSATTPTAEKTKEKNKTNKKKTPKE
ncbi:MAG: hypothetical protein K2K80_00295 [Clostridia bacterium]|nr:hypothetical protein [Clostridia bacterium]